MICHHYKCIFIHIPKNAGQSIENVFLKLLGLTWETRAPLLLRENDNENLGPPRLAHLRAEEYLNYKYISEDLFDNYFKFTFVRNPWSRMISFYKYLGYSKKMDFKTFLVKHFETKIFKEKYWFVRPQVEYIYSSSGDLLVDFVGRFENLNEDFDKVCKRLSINNVKLPYINSSNNKIDKHKTYSIENLLKSFKSKKIVKNNTICDSYQYFYDAETSAIVEGLYKKDIDVFGYTFENGE